MPELEPKEAGILEKLGVGGLLWLEGKLEQKPPKPIDLGRRKLLKEAALWTAYIGVLGGGGTLLRRFFIDNQQPQPAAAKDLKIPQATNSDISPNWQRNHDIDMLVMKAKERDLIILEANPIPMRVIKNAIFYQTSKEVILGINQKVLMEMLNHTQQNESIVFVFTDKNASSASISGAKLIVPVPLDLLWQQNVRGKNRNELYRDFSYNLSTQLAVAIEQTRQNPKERLISQTSLYNHYKEQFRKGYLKPPIEVVAINPSWIKEKLDQ